ncbi:MAG: aldolase [Candidatus Omnitrophica bacterium]|nr:aldolase [Candidatus Omnitrophota bacterium]
MVIYKKVADIFNSGIIAQENGQIVIQDQSQFNDIMIDDLATTIAKSDDPNMKKICYWIAHQAAISRGVVSSSIQGLYSAMGQKKIGGFTVPAINIRTLTYDVARAVFRCVKKINAGAFIFEIATSEIAYTQQCPMEYTSAILLAALKENYRGPIFILGDHFQVKVNKYLKNSETEIKLLRTLIDDAIDAGFYNIDIDASTLVDLSEENVDIQQELNCEVSALFTKHIRSVQPEGIEISIGAEIGEVGERNSTSSDLKAFMERYMVSTSSLKGLSKMSIQTGTSHGGVVLPDGSIAKVKIDFDTLRRLSEICRSNYALAGCVQHGASTLPNEAFHTFPQVGCAEIHLATQFQNIIYEHMPISLKGRIYDWLKENCANERKPGQTDDQFIYKTRKKALGPFKKEIFSLPQDLKDKISTVLEGEFDFMFSQLQISDTREIVDKYTDVVAVKHNKEHFLKDKE